MEFVAAFIAFAVLMIAWIVAPSQPPEVIDVMLDASETHREFLRASRAA